jgi:hypothetical protein
MPDAGSAEEIRKWHRFFAVECNNRAWGLSEATSRTGAQDGEMLDAAHAAAFHWNQVGTDVHRARADMLLAHVHALLGHGAIAMRHARASFDAVASRQSPAWEVAFAHAVLAHAAAAVHDASLHARHYALAKEVGSALPDEDRAIFDATFVHVPAPTIVSTGGSLGR